VLVSTTTPAGRAMAAKVCRDADAIFYVPLDILPAVERALQRARPDLVLLVQSELWPNFISAARRRGIPTMVVNGRVSDRTMRRLRVFGPLFRWVVRRVDRFCMQSGMDARRIVELGADPLRVADTGNVKFDQAGARVPQEERTRLARELGVAGAQTVIIAASTHPGEEKIALDAFHTVRQVDPAARLIIAPRHVGRAGEVEQAVAQAGLRARWRSRGAQTSPRAQGLSPRGLSQAEGTVLVFLRKAGTVPGGAGEPAEGPNTVVILDTIGELGRVYAIATAAFVGGSFVASVGGHNILEPAAQGVPSVFGPHMETQRDIGGVITEAQLGFQVHRPQDVGRALAWLLEDRKRLALIGGRCDEVLARHRGAADRCAAAAAEIIGYRAPGMQVWDVAQPPTAVNGRRVAQSLPRASRRVFNLRISQDAILCHSGAAPTAWLRPPALRRFVVSALSGCDRALLARLLVAVLTPASAVYWLGLKVNLLGYRLGLLRVTRLPAQVISVGNLTAGGTGKTSAAAVLAAAAVEGGKRPAVLSRGYGRRGARGKIALVSDGARVLVNHVSAGDEPVLLGRKVAGAAVLVGKDRRQTGRQAVAALGADVLILDDGFQYWRLAKDREIVLIDALCPFGNGRLLPAGILREPLSHLRRAHAVWITHADLAGPARVAAIRRRIARAFAGPIVETVHRAVDLASLDGGEVVDLGWLGGRPVAALSGIGNPRAFELTLERLGARVAPVRFPDHHHFRTDECRAVECFARRRGATIVTTEKDAVRLSAGMFTDPVWVLRVEMEAAEAGTALVTEKDWGRD
jgi:tetraacyldisaccharide 4'-kinase